VITGASAEGVVTEGFAVDPDLTDPTGVPAAAFADLAAPLIAGGVRRFYLLHTALPRLSEALSNLGFGRRSAYGVQPAAPRRGFSAVAVRIAEAGDLETIARLVLVEIQHRSAPPMFAPARTGPWPTWSPSTAPCARAARSIFSPASAGPTATLPGARGQGVGHALVDTALTWAHDPGYQWVSVDFDTANPLSRGQPRSAGGH
jgi:GNAT superfamily N-acetyltransferase